MCTHQIPFERSRFAPLKSPLSSLGRIFSSQAHQLLQILALVAYEHELSQSLAWIPREAHFLLGLPGAGHEIADLVLGLAAHPVDVGLPNAVVLGSNPQISSSCVARTILIPMSVTPIRE